MKKPRFVPINSKVNVIIILALVVGIGSISFYLTTEITTTIDELLADNLNQQSEILFAAIENFMIPGEAKLAVNFFETMVRSSADYSISLFRRNGKVAFSDETTIKQVIENAPAIASMFDTMAERITTKESVNEAYFQTAVGAPPLSVFFEEKTEDGATYFRAYKPLINLPKCTGCHGTDHTVRGVIDIRDDISGSRRQQLIAAYSAGGFFVGMVFLLAFILTGFMRKTVIKPIKIVGEVCAKVTDGQFDQRVTIKNNDEIGRLGNTVNKMVEGLHERFELSKYVSASTIGSLRDSKDGQVVSITMLFSDIRGFTAYSERNSPDKVVENLNRVLNVQTEIILANGGDIDKYVGDEIVAMFTGEDQCERACRSAIEIQKTFRENGGKSFDGLRLGVGINTGEVILGMIGSKKRADYTFIGDNVNTASRLCSAAQPGEILIADTTYAKTGAIFRVDGPFRLKAKGKDLYVKVYKLAGMKE
ncbi:MAG: adenylate/guanylate cyclase domain-containing protein [Spirochaetales bacterium]|nr:adenylate/guanylate cyclase domain-containing protein [Spirochaetales bacterium]